MHPQAAQQIHREPGAEPEPRCCAHLLARRDAEPYCTHGHPGAACSPDCADYRPRLLTYGDMRRLEPLDLTNGQRVRANTWARVIARHQRSQTEAAQ